jgi:hypothetical protein
MTTTPNRVLHLMLIDLKPEVDSARRERLIGGWEALSVVSGVVSLGVVPESAGGTHGLGLFALIDDITSSENFGTDSQHMTFLGEHFIPAFRGFAGADLFVGDAVTIDSASALFFLFTTPARVYDWQIRAAFDGLSQEARPVAVYAGTAINMRQRYQAGGVIFFDTAPGAEAFATSEQFGRIRAQHFDPISTDLALLWGAVRLIEM